MTTGTQLSLRFDFRPRNQSLEAVESAIQLIEVLFQPSSVLELYTNPDSPTFVFGEATPDKAMDAPLRKQCATTLDMEPISMVEERDFPTSCYPKGTALKILVYGWGILHLSGLGEATRIGESFTSAGGSLFVLRLGCGCHFSF